MALFRPNSARVGFTAGLCLAVCSVSAQTTAPAPAPAQSIFTSASTPGVPEHHFDVNKQIQAPRSLFDQPGGDSLAPVMPPPVNYQRPPVKPQRNWTEMTPDEIMGLPPSEKDLAAKTPGQHQPVPYQSPLENFLMSQRLAQTGSTNRTAPNLGWNFPGAKPDSAGLQPSGTARNGSTVHTQLFDRLLQGTPDSPVDPLMNPPAAWGRMFNVPAQTSPTEAQLADMAAFRQILEPTATPAPISTESASTAKFLPGAAHPDPNLEPAKAGFNPAGATFLPLASGINHPKRLAPLPNVTGSGLTAPAAPPPWAAQPPPWTVANPQTIVFPVRKF